MKKCVNLVVASMILVCAMCGAEQHIIIENGAGEKQELNIHEDASFADVIRVLDTELYLAERQRDVIDDDTMPAVRSMQMNILVSNQRISVKAGHTSHFPTNRDYSAPVTQQNADDIYFIVKTLANESLITIKGKESDLKAAGDRIDRVHPLNFLATIFTNEELKVCIRNLDGRSWVWKDFQKGLIESLTDENASSNVLQFADNFASRIGVDKSIFLKPMKSGDWPKFIKALIEGVPRQGQSQRHDM